MLSKLLIGLVSFVAVAPSAQAQNADPRVREGIEFFATFCVATGGQPDRALSVIGQGNELARRLPDDMVKHLQGGREGGLGWTIRSPNDAELLLTYDADGICGVSIGEADAAAVRATFEAMATGVAKGRGTELTSRKPIEQNSDRIPTTYFEYSIPLGTRNAHLSLTSAQQPVSGKQHHMTFTFVQLDRP